MRRQFTTGWSRVNPNMHWRHQITMRYKRLFHGESWRRRLTLACREIGSYLKGLWRERILFVLWGGERYDTRESIKKVLHPHEVIKVTWVNYIPHVHCTYLQLAKGAGLYFYLWLGSRSRPIKFCPFNALWPLTISMSHTQQVPREALLILGFPWALSWMHGSTVPYVAQFLYIIIVYIILYIGWK